MYQIGYLIPSKEVALTESDELVLIKPITEINIDDVSDSFDFQVAFSIILNVTLQTSTLFKISFEDPDGNEVNALHFLGEGEPKAIKRSDDFFNVVNIEVPFGVKPERTGLHYLILHATFSFSKEDGTPDEILDSKKVPIIVTDDQMYTKLIERDADET